MATYTDNYQLTKPTMAETADIRTINGNMDTIDDILHASQISLADAYDSTQTYNTDDVVMYEFLMYKCLEDNVTGTWDATKWERTVASSSGASGTEVVPNPQGTPTADLNTIGIAGDIFNIAGSGGGGNVYGAFIDTNRVIQANTIFNSDTSYTATEDCAVVYSIAVNTGTNGQIFVDGKEINAFYSGNGIMQPTDTLYLKAGQTVSFKPTYSSGTSSYTVYGLTFGTQNIFTPQIYSTEERCVGVWIDNKPLYAKTYPITFSSNYVDITVDSTHEIKLLDGGVDSNNHDNFIHLGYTSQSDLCGAYEYELGKICFQNTYYASRPIGWLTTFYTKTTDTAGSGSYNTLGVPTHHYSTEEQVIGTWIDGKPLYEKTITGTVTINSRIEGIFYYGTVDISSLNIDTGFFIDEASYYMDGTNNISFVNGSVNETTLELWTHYPRTNVHYTITLRFTKTTD